jgi:hypothetical protein
LLRATTNELKHKDYQPPQEMLCPCIGGKEQCVDQLFGVPIEQLS